MNYRTILAYLEPVLGEYKKNGKEIRFNCPKPGCDDGGKFNLELNTSKNIFNCWSCRYSGYIKKLLREYATDPGWKSLPGMESETVFHSEEAKQIDYPKKTIPYYLNADVKRYLEVDRGIKREFLRKRNVSYVYGEDERYFGHVCFPFYENKRLVGACVMDFATKKYRNLSKLDFVPYREFINPRYPVFITEGVFDALSVPNGIPLFRTDINIQTLEYLSSRDVIVGVDNTVPMQQYANLLRKVDEHQPRTLILFDMKNFKDPNEFLKKNPKRFVKEIMNCYQIINESTQDISHR